MKTRLDLPDDMVRALPLVECAHEARPGEEITPERLAEVLLDEESPGAAARDLDEPPGHGRGGLAVRPTSAP